MQKFCTVALLVLVGLMALPASAAITIRLSDTGSGVLVTCPPSGIPLGPNAIQCGTIDGAFSLTITTSAQDNVPGGTTAHQGKTLNVTVGAAGVGQTLTLEVASTGFTLPPVGPIALTESITANNPLASGSFGTVTGTGYLSNTNTAFDYPAGNTSGTASIVCTAAGVGAGCDASGAFFNTAASTNGGNISNVPFALNEIMTFTPTTAGLFNFTGDLSAAVPEPTSVVLLGTVLLGATGLLRKKFKRA